MTYNNNVPYYVNTTQNKCIIYLNIVLLQLH